MPDWSTRVIDGPTEVGGLYAPHFRHEWMRVWIYAVALPMLALTGGLRGRWWIMALVALALGYGANWLRTA